MLFRLPLSFILPRLLSILLGQARPLRSDFRAMLQSLPTMPRVEGADHIPCEAFIAIVNHYHRPDLPAMWPIVAAVLAISDRRHACGLPPATVVIATQWTFPDRLRQATIGMGSRWLFDRIIRAYGLLGMEPPTLGNAAIERRARSVRRTVEAARMAKERRGAIVIAPQGGDAEGGAMTRPPGGAGRFLALLGATGVRFLPVGAWAEGEQIIVSVGESYCLSDALRAACQDRAKDEQDECVLRVAMGRVASLLPPPLRGYYA